MNSYILESLYKSLGVVLNELSDSAAAQEPLKTKIGNALSFYNELAKEYSRVIEENKTLTASLYMVASDQDKNSTDDQQIELLISYTNMKRNGGSPSDVYMKAISDGKSFLEAIKIIRSTFSLSLQEAFSATEVGENQNLN